VTSPAASSTPPAPREPSTGSPPVYVRVGFSLEDLSSDVGTTQLSVFYDDSTGQAGSLDSLVPAIQLVTYPERAPVAFDVVVVPATAAKPSDPVPKDSDASAPISYGSSARLDVNPKTPLASGWYELSLTSIPRAAEVDGFLWKTPGGMPAARFNPAHAPVRRNVTICDKGANVRAIVEFSEALTVAPLATSLLVGDGAGRACSLALPPGVPAQQAGTFDCDASIWTSKHLHIETRAGLVSAKGAAPAGVINTTAKSSADVVDTSPRNDDFDFSKVRELSPHCRMVL
jgi:hypothetical protein